MGFYERQFGETEKEKQKTAQPERPRGRLSGNYDRLLIDNFKLLLCFLPFFDLLLHRFGRRNAFRDAARTGSAYSGRPGGCGHVR